MPSTTALAPTKQFAVPRKHWAQGCGPTIPSLSRLRQSRRVSSDLAGRPSPAKTSRATSAAHSRLLCQSQCPDWAHLHVEQYETGKAGSAPTTSPAHHSGAGSWSRAVPRHYPRRGSPQAQDAEGGPVRCNYGINSTVDRRHYDPVSGAVHGIPAPGICERTRLQYQSYSTAANRPRNTHSDGASSGRLRQVGKSSFTYLPLSQNPPTTVRGHAGLCAMRVGGCARVSIEGGDA